ncbi:hypothetical protein ACFFQF_16720 [Haladaptatus pallidirubidus]|uniref:Uncharacterized protein n=1 Tax=Haladaptatus pallidirubidus TaxID=1008152 RepID=A0AAV3US46_9EURY|nr:hypothetical protein [Haladaptatus pallidirubidus]
MIELLSLIFAQGGRLPAEFFGFIFANILTLLFGSILTLLSYRAYHLRKTQPFKFATIGFAVITFGSILEAIYEVGVRRSFDLSSQELIALHSVESLLLALGLGLLFYSISRQ